MAEETVIRLKLWGVIAAFIMCVGFLIATDRQLENRVTRIEAQYEAVMANLIDLKQMTEDIRQDQIRRYNREVNGK